jgi:rhodanese-related sulfurtransferase
MAVRFVVAAAATAGVWAILGGFRADTTGIETLEVAELARYLGSDTPPVVCDANSKRTRARYGIIPGARRLSAYRDYDVGAELPGDRGAMLVFYCRSEMCGSAAEAARTAIAAGHSNVFVLPAGIRGWVRAGRPVEGIEGMDDA